MYHCLYGALYKWGQRGSQRETCSVKQHGRGRNQNSSFLTLGFINEEDSKSSFKPYLPFTEGESEAQREKCLT